MKFRVFLVVGPITDPEDPSNVLEGLRFRKGTLKVSSPYEKMSYCSIEPSYTIPPTTTSNIPSISSAFAVTTIPGKTVYPDVGSPMMSGHDWEIRVGDVVEQLLETETGDGEK